MFNKIFTKKLGRFSPIICASLVALVFTHSSVSAAKIDDIKRQIKQTEKTASDKRKQRKLLENELEKSEQAIAKSALEMSETKAIIDEKRKSLIALQKTNEELKENKVKQQALLQQQLISAYMSGQNDLLKLILNQEDLSQVVRANSYYHYLNKARLEGIEDLERTQKQLDENETEMASGLAALETIYEQQKATRQELSKQQSKRDKALEKLKQDLSYQTAKLAQLNHSEKRLSERIKKASQARQENELAAATARAAKASKSEDKSFSKFATLKGKLDWPIKGKILSTFGSQRTSQVKWKGIAIATNEGEKVRAVATGKVLFAGYFKGYGMVIALDHGDNYITLYGYNQTLLQKTGDVVFQGDAIALAGHSGGQDKNSLYFELSHKGKAENPLKWLKPRRR